MHKLWCMLLALLCGAASAQIPDPQPEHLPDSLPARDTADVAVVEPEATFSQLPLAERLQQLLADDIFERTQVGLYVYDLTDDSLLFAYHERQCMRPASNQKLVTAITALATLGTDYRYQTGLYAILPSPADSGVCRSLCVKAGYDPLFAAADMQAFADTLRARGVSRVEGTVWIDRSFKDDKQWGWGWCWDDDEVPLDPLLYDNRPTFVAHLEQALQAAGIDCCASFADGPVPTQAQWLCSRTHSLDEVLVPMMKQSDTSMAESLFYQLAAHSGKRQAGRKQAVAQVEKLIRRLGLDPDHYQIADGSGLSLYNYLTPQLLGCLLRYAYSHEELYLHLLPSLPVAAHDGTLRKRMKGTCAAGNVQAKTGTVEGVSTLSGYCTAGNGHRLCFSIMNQGIRHTSTGRNFQDRVCRVLCQ